MAPSTLSIMRALKHSPQQKPLAGSISIVFVLRSCFLVSIDSLVSLRFKVPG